MVPDGYYGRRASRWRGSSRHTDRKLAAEKVKAKINLEHQIYGGKCDN